MTLAEALGTLRDLIPFRVSRKVHQAAVVVCAVLVFVGSPDFVPLYQDLFELTNNTVRLIAAGAAVVLTVLRALFPDD
jgi:nitric oxide reductase large subunit